MTPQKKIAKNQKQTNSSLTFADHLSELRSRLMAYFFLLLVGIGLGYVIYPKILNLLLKPINQPLFYTSPAGGLELSLQIAIFFGFLVSLPFLIYQLIRFIEPAISKKHTKLINLALIVSSFFLIMGILFAYYVSLPAALYFLAKFSNDQIQSLISTKEYLSFVIRYTLGFGLVFQLPLVMVVINFIHPISLKKLFQQEKIVILVSFILAAILTPTPDIFNQLVMAVPMILLYQLSIFLVWLINRKKTKLAL